MGGLERISFGWLAKGAALALVLFATPGVVAQPVTVVGESGGVHAGELACRSTRARCSGPTGPTPRR